MIYCQSVVTNHLVKIVHPYTSCKLCDLQIWTDFSEIYVLVLAHTFKNHDCATKV